MPDSTAPTTIPSAQACDRVRALARLLADANGIRIAGSPLLGGWDNFDDSANSPEGLALDDPELIAFEASYEQDGDDYNECITVANLFAARFDGCRIAFPDEHGNESFVELFQVGDAGGCAKCNDEKLIGISPLLGGHGH